GFPPGWCRSDQIRGPGIPALLLAANGRAVPRAKHFPRGPVLPVEPALATQSADAQDAWHPVSPEVGMGMLSEGTGRVDSRTPQSTTIDDVQAREDARGIPLDEVGVTDLSYPIVVRDRAHKSQHTVARLSMSVSLPHHFKGTHMSRFIEAIEEHRGELTMRTLPAVLETLRCRLEAEAARVEVVFPYFLQREAPVTNARALMDYQCTFSGSSDSRGTDFVLGVRLPVTSLCPCSKEI